MSDADEETLVRARQSRAACAVVREGVRELLSKGMGKDAMGKGKGTQETCEYCLKKGHTKPQCWWWLNKGKGKGGDGKAASSGQSVGMSAAFSGKCLGCNIQGHHVKDCRKISKEDKERILKELKNKAEARKKAAKCTAPTPLSLRARPPAQ